MKGRHRYIVSLFLLFGLFACSGSRQLIIDVRQPASLTMPQDIVNVLVVNNALPQPNDARLEVVFDGNPIELTDKFNTDTLSWIVVESLFAELEASGFFNEVAFFNKRVRSDDQWLAHVPLSAEFKDNVFSSDDFDAIISIDRVLFTLADSIKRNSSSEGWADMYVYMNARVDAKILSSVYLYNKEKAFSTFEYTDSLFYKSTIGADSSYIFHALPQQMINELAVLAGSELVSYFAPVWESQERFVYTGSDSRMREAGSYANSNRWDLAQAIWIELYNTQSKAKDRARLAANIALSYEMQDNFAAALQWAEKAEALLIETSSTNSSEELSYVKEYVINLQKRVLNTNLLNLQFGEVK